VLVAAFCAAFGCSERVTPQEGSETHFLTECDASCDAGSACVCGVCTKTCSADTQCSALGAAATCVSLTPRIAEGRCEATAPPAMCDVACLASVDCSDLGADFVCQAGYCREAGAPSSSPAPLCQGQLTSDDIVVMGDALIELSTFTSDLEERAAGAGLVAQGTHFRDYASHLYSVLASGPLSIANQYATLRSDGPARVIVMDGGETDVLNVPCGSAPTPKCPAITAAAAGAESLLAQMAADGVEHLIYFFYGDPVGNVDVKAGLDVLRPFVENACGRAALPCHFIDLRPIFEGHPEYAAADGLIFSDAGAAASASAVIKTMIERCVAGSQ
jgi:hypothetical protein